MSAGSICFLVCEIANGACFSNESGIIWCQQPRGGFRLWIYLFIFNSFFFWALAQFSWRRSQSGKPCIRLVVCITLMPRNELLCPKCEYSHPKMMPAQDGRFTFWARNWSFLFIVEIWLGGRIGWGQLLDISVLSVQIASSFPLLGKLFHLCLLWTLLHMASEFFNPVCSVSLFPIIYWQKCLVFICCIISFAPQCLLDTS